LSWFSESVGCKDCVACLHASDHLGLCIAVLIAEQEPSVNAETLQAHQDIGNAQMMGVAVCAA